MILYIQTAFLGDLLLSIPTLLRLRELYPDKEIHLLCRKNLGSVLLKEKLVDRVFDQFKKNKPDLWEAHKYLSQQKYDLVVCPHESFRSLLILKLIRAQQKISFKNPFNFIFRFQTLERPMHHPEVLRQLSLLQTLDPQSKNRLEQVKSLHAPFSTIPEWSQMGLLRFSNKGEFKNKLKQKINLQQDKKIICLAPGSVWPTKRWGEDKFSDLAQSLIQKDCTVLMVGSTSEIEIGSRIQQKVPDVINWIGKTGLEELTEILAGVDCLVSNDSGTMHMAAMTMTPTVSIFGPTVTEFGYQPWNPQAVVIENKSLNCRPCSSHGTQICPLGTHECMNSILVKQVESSVLKI